MLCYMALPLLYSCIYRFLQILSIIMNNIMIHVFIYAQRVDHRSKKKSVVSLKTFYGKERVNIYLSIVYIYLSSGSLEDPQGKAHP